MIGPARRAPLVIALVTCLLSCATAVAGGSAAVLVARKVYDLDLDDAEARIFDPLEEQAEYGVLLTWGPDEWPVSLALDVLSSEGEGSASYSGVYYGYGAATYSFSLEVLELHGGIRREFGKRRFRGYVGVGIAYLDAEFSFGGRLTGVAQPLSVEGSDSRAVFGPWFGFGLLYEVGRRVFLGVDLRLSDGKTDFDIPLPPAGRLRLDDVRIGGRHVGGFVGFRWGR